MIEFQIIPVPKPRMTRGDVWKKRPCVTRYWTFKDELVRQAKKARFKLDDKYKVEFLMPVPKSWPILKQIKMIGEPHKQKPDLDNLLKAIQDCLLVHDEGIWRIEASKIWWDTGKIIFYKI